MYEISKKGLEKMVKGMVKKETGKGVYEGKAGFTIITYCGMWQGSWLEIGTVQQGHAKIWISEEGEDSVDVKAFWRNKVTQATGLPF